MKKEEKKYIYENLEEIRWRLKCLGEIENENWARRFKSLHEEICELEEKLEAGTKIIK